MIKEVMMMIRWKGHNDHHGYHYDGHNGYGDHYNGERVRPEREAYLCKSESSKCAKNLWVTPAQNCQRGGAFRAPVNSFRYRCTTWKLGNCKTNKVILERCSFIQTISDQAIITYLCEISWEEGHVGVDKSPYQIVVERPPVRCALKRNIKPEKILAKKLVLAIDFFVSPWWLQCLRCTAGKQPRPPCLQISVHRERKFNFHHDWSPPSSPS